MFADALIQFGELLILGSLLSTIAVGGILTAYFGVRIKLDYQRIRKV